MIISIKNKLYKLLAGLLAIVQITDMHESLNLALDYIEHLVDQAFYHQQNGDDHLMMICLDEAHDISSKLDAGDEIITLPDLVQ